MMHNDGVLTSVVSYPERGTGGSSRYRGNCSARLIEDLIRFYKPAEVCDYMVGSGTTFHAAAACGITCHGYDLNSGFDLLSCDLPQRSEFTFFHPPYWDIIHYSGEQYSAKDIEARYGFDPTAVDLSRIPTWEKFVESLNHCMIKMFSALERGGRLAVLMGDIKKHGRLYSMLTDIVKPGCLEQILIKMQHNCTSDRSMYRGKRFIPIEHEYVMVVRKDTDLIFPVMLNRTYNADMRDIQGSTWRDVVAAVMDQRQGPWTLEDIYKDLEGHQKAKRNPNWQAKVRQTLQRYPSLFRHDGRNQWSRVAA